MVKTLRDINEPRPQYPTSGEEHGLLKVLPNSVPENDFKRFKESDRAAMKKLRDEESRMVTVKYINTVSQLERLERPYCRWDGDPIFQYKFIPNHTYTVPKGLVDEVNGKKIMKRTGLIDPNTKKELMADTYAPLEHMFISAAEI
jgi:hypothetical protein